MHKLAVIEKLRERISDDDKLVRETLYQLLKAVIFPSCREVIRVLYCKSSHIAGTYILNVVTNFCLQLLSCLLMADGPSLLCNDSAAKIIERDFFC